MQLDRRIILAEPTGVASASRGFRRYCPMTQQQVRSLKVNGNELDRLRQKLVLLREMSPDQARQAIDFRALKLNFFEALELAKSEGKILVPNDVIDRILTETNAKLPWHRTGTLVIYEAPGKPFGEKVVHSDVVNFNTTISFEVPLQFRGKTDCALVIEHPDFELVSQGDNHEIRVDDTSKIHPFEHFPTTRGTWHSYDKKFRIPTGETVQESDNARLLWRLGGCYIGSFNREVYDCGRRRAVGASFDWSDVSRVALF